MTNSRSLGARTVGVGEGREVRYWFCLRAAWRGGAAEGGVIKVISIEVVRSRFE